MAKFHINNKGEPGKCGATSGGCPFGSDAEHFTSIEAARAQSEKQLAEANGWGAAKRETLSPAAIALMEEITQYENNPARHHYGFPEDEMTRYNIDKAIGERKEKLRSMIPLADFTHLRTSVSNEDTAYGVKQVATRLGNSDPQFSWDRVMGDTRRTAKAITTYNNACAGAVAGNKAFKAEVDSFAKKHRDQEVFARAFVRKYEIPEQYEKAFEETWAGNTTGEKHLKSELASLKADRVDYNEGRLSATRVVGTGLRNPKVAAEQYFAKRERELNRAIETRGRSYAVNVSNVLYKARQENWPYSR